MNDVIIPILMWLSDPQVIPSIITTIKSWYNWRMSKIYIPKGMEQHYHNINETIDTMFNKKGKK